MRTHRVCIQRETTERRQKEEGLRRRADALEELARLRSDFVASVSHELRTPLTAILGFAELLEGRWDQLSEARRERQIRHIASSATRQLRLVEDLLPAGRLDGQALVPASQCANLAALNRQASTEVTGSYPNQQIELAGPEDLAVRVDPDRVVQIVVNLLDNAAKCSPKGSPVVAWWDREGAMAVLRVRDWGSGVPEAGAPRSFPASDGSPAVGHAAAGSAPGWASTWAASWLMPWAAPSTCRLAALEAAPCASSFRSRSRTRSTDRARRFEVLWALAGGAPQHANRACPTSVYC